MDNAFKQNCMSLVTYILDLSLVQMAIRRHQQFSNFIDPHSDSFPRPATVLFSISSYVGILVIGATAIAFPTSSMEKVVIVFGAFEFGMLFFLTYRDYRQYRHSSRCIS